jgi:hypothetical protein
MSDAKKCPHPPCSCTLEKGQSYCRAYCEGAKGTTADLRMWPSCLQRRSAQVLTLGRLPTAPEAPTRLRQAHQEA